MPSFNTRLKVTVPSYVINVITFFCYPFCFCLLRTRLWTLTGKVIKSPFANTGGILPFQKVYDTCQRYKHKGISYVVNPCVAVFTSISYYK